MGNFSASDRDSSALFAARRRRLLLTVGGITLTSVVGSRLLSGPAGHLPPHREMSANQQPAAQRALTARRNPPAHHDPVTHHRPPRPPDQPLYYVDDASRAIALTIDDGPDPVYTPQVLRVLHRYGVTATFSMIGEAVKAK